MQRKLPASKGVEVSVLAAGQPLKATLVWTAAPGEVIPLHQHEHFDTIRWLDESDARALDSDFLARCNRRT